MPTSNEIADWRPKEGMNNRIWNCKNPFQGDFKKVLCVCSAGLLRSPTTAWVLSNAPYDYNTRAAGLEESFALIPVDEALIEWADEIVCMTKQHHEMLEQMGVKKPIVCLNVPDNFAYRDPTLVRMIREAYDSSK